ncbi:hypothetical protein ABZ707_29950 [Streptomyces sp. NPDC006923]|uniref:hypothetical protein n=1 Tax=Streptomyces sp. NPDC006923 TaxID=3155355 RepID=UPI0033C418BE
MPRPAEWQRHYAALRELVADEECEADVLPGVTVHGMDVGRFLAKTANTLAGRA